MSTNPDPLSEAVTKLLACQPAHASRDYCHETMTLQYHTERGAIEIMINGPRGDVRNVSVRLSHGLEQVYGEEVMKSADYWGWNWVSRFAEKKRKDALDQVLSAINTTESAQ